MKLSERVERVEVNQARANATSTRKARTRPTTSAPERWGQDKRRVRDALLEDLGPKLYERHGEAELRSVVAAHLDEALRTAGVTLVASRRAKFVSEVAADLLGYGPLDPLLADPAVTEIMCNSHDDVYVERRGKIEHTDAVFFDESQFRQVIDKIVATVGRRIDEASPMVDARLPDGSRVNVVLPPGAVHSAVLTIRRFPPDPYEVKDLISFGTLSVDVAVFLEACVRGKLNVVVSGGTGTGKTTTLNVLSAFVPDGERIVTIEDAAELRLHQQHVVSLESRPANIEGAGEVTIRDLVRNALRMRPDRIIVGEVRGAEALDMLQAMNTGHEGSLTTIHCNSPRDALSRLETMVLMAGYDLPLRAIRQQIASALDVVVHLDRFGDGSRHVVHVAELQGMEGEVITLQDIYRYSFAEGGHESARSAGRLRPTGLRPKLVDKLREAGVDLPPKLFRDAKADGSLNPRVAAVGNGRATRRRG
jgi:pilus assembly protein CpaF